VEPARRDVAALVHRELTRREDIDASGPTVLQAGAAFPLTDNRRTRRGHMARSSTRTRDRPAAWQVPAALLLLGACAVGVGLLLRGPLAAGAAEEADALQVAPVIDARSLNDVAVGTRVLAYGRIATTTEAPHGLVAFVRQQYEGTEEYAPNKKRPRWRELARHTPALQLDVDGRMVSIAAGEYALDSPPHERAPEGGPVASTLRFDLRLVDLSTQRVRGFAAGDAVTVDATVTAAAVAASAGAADGARTLQAQRLHDGDVAAYRAARSAGVDALPMIGAIFTALGLAVLALGGTLLRRALRTPPAAQGEPA
jgi:hypothetical protein